MKKKISAALLLLSALSATIAAETRIASVFTDNMVLQRDKYLPVWGTDEPNSLIVVSFDGHEAVAITGNDGKWLAQLPPLQVGGPYELTVSGSSTKTFVNVMVGEVWFVSGQSNMAMTVKNSNNADEEIAAANHPEIRFFRTEHHVAGKPADFLSRGEKWEVCSPETAGNFSAAAYYFGRELHKKYNVPVGLINSSWGGTNIESWMSGNMLYSIPETRPYIEWVWEKNFDYDAKTKENEVVIAEINSIIENAHVGEKMGVGLPTFNNSLWGTMNIPIHFHNTPISGYQGFVWFSKTFNLPEGYTGKGLELTLGKIEEKDETFFNMVPIGKTTNTGKLRQYTIPAKAVTKGANTIAVKVLHRRDNGGGLYEGPFLLVDKGSGKTLLNLEGEWKFSQEVEVKLPRQPLDHWHVSTLYNYMVAPFVPFGIRGAVWYQGENNTDASYHYAALLKGLITDWRVQWRQGYFPFIVVQLPTFGESKPEPADNGWTELREAQARSEELINVAMAVTVDLGDSLDIHPKDKQEVGQRVFLAARAAAYNEAVSGAPVYKDYTIEAGGVRIRFDLRGNNSIKPAQTPLTGFEIAGEDHKFYWADALLVGNEVVVSSDKVKTPVAVRYGWSPNPALSLFGSSGLPVIPFRTDDWQGATYGKTKKYDTFHY